MSVARIVPALVMSIVTVVGEVCAQSRDSLIVHYTDGVRMAVEGRYEEALGELEKALETDPGHAPSLYEAAEVVMDAEGNVAKALDYSARAVELDPGNIWYKQLRARVLLSAGRDDEATALLEEMVAEGGRGFDPDSYRMLAIMYYRKGRTDDALATLDSAAVKLGVTPGIVDMKRSLLIEAGRIDEAVALTEEYVAGEPYDEENRLALAQIYAYQGRDSLQAETLKHVVEINPDNAEALGALADLYLARGQGTLYLAALRQLFTLPGVTPESKMDRFETLALNTGFYRNHFFEMGQLAMALMTEYPGDPRVVELYADHAVRGGEAEAALVTVKNRLAKPEPTLGLYMKAIEIEAWLGRGDSVALWSDRALKIFPGEMGIYMLRSSALQYMGRPKEAQKTLARALRVARTDSLRSEIHGAIGTLWHEEGNLRKTFAAYEKALAYGANNALVLNNYAYFLALEERELDRALGMAQRAVRLDEGNSSYLDTYAWVLYKLGDYAEARRVMQQALPLDRNQSAVLMIHYGDILWALGEKFMASVYWKRAREAGWKPDSEIEERLARTTGE